MTTQVLHPVAVDYLKRLSAAARWLPRGRRTELMSDIEAHLAEAIPPDATNADALNVIERLGTPEDIVAAEDPRPAAPADARTTREWAAIILLLFGGFVFGIGWLAGLILLWSSPNWTAREKWLGSLVVPGGWAAAFFALTLGVITLNRGCVGTPGEPLYCGDQPSVVMQVVSVAVIAVLILGPLFTAIFLARRAKTAPALRS